MKTEYTKGFEAGVDWARTQVIEFLNSHYDHGDTLTFEEVIKEVEHWQTEDREIVYGLADGLPAPTTPEQAWDTKIDKLNAELSVIGNLIKEIEKGVKK